MKALIPALMTIVMSAQAQAARGEKPALCQREVEKQEAELASEGGAQPENRLEALRQVEEGETDLGGREYDEVRAALHRHDVVVFSFSNDAGTWITIAKKKGCKVVITAGAYGS